jgi:hypothetical protein
MSPCREDAENVTQHNENIIRSHLDLGLCRGERNMGNFRLEVSHI